MCKHLLHLVEMSCSLACLLVSQAASFHNDCSRPPVAGSRCDEYSYGTPFRPASSRRRRLLERQGCPEVLPWSATRHATAHPLLPSIVFGTMPHVAAYGVLLVQALFFFLGGESNPVMADGRQLVHRHS